MSADLSKATLNELYSMQVINEGYIASAKEKAAEIAGELNRRYAASVKQALNQADKTHGSMTLPLQDGLSLKTDTKQTVAWDSDALQTIARELPWERVAALFKIKFSMGETIYKGIAAAAPELRAKIDDARTTTIGEPVITLVKAS